MNRVEKTNLDSNDNHSQRACCTNPLSESCRCQNCSKYATSNQREDQAKAENAAYALSYADKLDSRAVFNQMIQKQHKNRFYNKSAFHIDIRLSLIKWLEQLKDKLTYSETTYHLSCAILDAVLSVYAVENRHIKMICFMSLHLAAKLHEQDAKILEMVHVKDLFKNEFQLRDIFNCEQMIFRVLDYSPNIKTPYVFLKLLLSQEMLSVNDLDLGASINNFNQTTDRFDRLCNLFIKASLMDYSLYKFSALAVATSVIVMARKQLLLDNIWTEKIGELTPLSMRTIIPCADKLYNTCKLHYKQELCLILAETTRPERGPFIKLDTNFSRLSTASDFKSKRSLRNNHNSNIKVSEFNTHTHELSHQKNNKEDFGDCA